MQIESLFACELYVIIISLWQGLKRKGKVIYNSSSILPKARRQSIQENPKERKQKLST